MPDQQSQNCYMMQMGPAWGPLGSCFPVPGLVVCELFGRLILARDDREYFYSFRK